MPLRLLDPSPSFSRHYFMGIFYWRWCSFNIWASVKYILCSALKESLIVLGFGPHFRIGLTSHRSLSIHHHKCFLSQMQYLGVPIYFSSFPLTDILLSPSRRLYYLSPFKPPLLHNPVSKLLRNCPKLFWISGFPERD